MQVDLFPSHKKHLSLPSPRKCYHVPRDWKSNPLERGQNLEYLA